MNKNLIFLSLIVAIIFHGCIRSSSNDISTNSIDIKLDIKEDINTIHDIDLIKKVEIVNLDCDEVIIGNIDKVVRFGSIIYLMDKYQNNSVYIFDTKGSYINSISNYGNGPEEYLQLTDIFVDFEDSTLNVLSRVDSKLFKYDLEGKKLLSIKKTPKSFTSLQKTSDGYVGFMSNWIQDSSSPYNVFLMSEKLEIIEHFFEIDNKLQNRSNADGYVFSKYCNSYYYITPLDYNIYTVNNSESIDKKYQYDFGSNKMPNKLKLEMLNDKQRLELINKYVYRFHHFQETDKYLIVHFIFQGQSLLGVHNKETRNSEVIELSPYNNEYFIPFGEIIGFDEETIYTTIEASNLKRIWDGKDEYNNYEEEYPRQIDNLRKKIKTIREDGNPFLILYIIN